MFDSCVWGKDKNNECKLLCTVQCKINGKCSFYEDPITYEKRQQEYQKLIQPYIDRLNKIREKKQWNDKKYNKIKIELLVKNAKEKERFLNKLRDSII